MARLLAGKPDYSRFLVRLESFRNIADIIIWNVSKESLAQGGFYYKSINRISYVICPYCHLKIGGWLSPEKTFIKHFRLAPKCRFIRMLVLEIINPLDITMDFKRLASLYDYNASIISQVEFKGDILSVFDELNVLDIERNITHEMRCVICYTRQRDVLLLNCNHLCCCSRCSELIGTCPICRRNIENVLKIYTS